jgi:hypothetical protein
VIAHASCALILCQAYPTMNKSIVPLQLCLLSLLRQGRSLDIALSASTTSIIGCNLHKNSQDQHIEVVVLEMHKYTKV